MFYTYDQELKIQILVLYFLTHGSDKAGRLEPHWVSAGGIASEQGHLELIDVNLSRTISIAHAEIAVRLCITDINIQKR